MKRLVLVALCLSCGSSVDPSAIDQCRHSCLQAKNANVDLSNGPCLSDSLPSGVVTPDVVCDVAHEPRQPVDDQAQNQCKAYLNGSAHHFVEVDPNCTFLRAE